MIRDTTPPKSNPNCANGSPAMIVSPPHFTPTSCSWFNAIERFFARLTKQRLKPVFLSVADLQRVINRYPCSYWRFGASHKAVTVAWQLAGAIEASYGVLSTEHHRGNTPSP